MAAVSSLLSAPLLPPAYHADQWRQQMEVMRASQGTGLSLLASLSCFSASLANAALLRFAGMIDYPHRPLPYAILYFLHAAAIHALIASFKTEVE
jgi:hypothetical protein